jgi:hypothetical protein
LIGGDPRRNAEKEEALVRWNAWTIQPLRELDPGAAKRFEEARSHDERLSILSAYLAE